MKLDDVIDYAKGDMIKWGVGKVVERFALSKLLLVPVVGPILSYLITEAVSAVVDAFDYIGFYQYKAIRNSSQAETYQDSVIANIKAAESGDDDEIKKTEDARFRDFAALMSLSN